MPEAETILITGASGFLGTWLAQAAHAQGFELLGLDIVESCRPELWSGFALQRCENADFASLIGSRRLHTVFHLAGGASVPESVKNPSADFMSLLPGTVEMLLFLARERRSAHFVFFSSAAVYGTTAELPVAETAPVMPISPYGVHKAAGEFLIEHYARLFQLRASLLRTFSAYGEGLRRQILWDLCRKAMVAQRDGDDIVLHGTGDETRDFIHAADVAIAALLIARHPPRSGTQIFNVASGEETAIRTVAECVLNALGCDRKVTFAGTCRTGDPANWRADVSKLRALNFAPTILFPEGVANYVRWQKELEPVSFFHSAK